MTEAMYAAPVAESDGSTDRDDAGMAAALAACGVTATTLRIVPGSQRWPGTPRDQMSDLKAPHPQEVYVTAPAGSVLVFNSHAWHGSTTNRSQRTRRVYHCAFIAREHPQQTSQRQYLRPETATRLTPAARYLLDV